MLLRSLSEPRGGSATFRTGIKLLGGIVSVAFTKLLLGLRQKFLIFPKKTLWFQPKAGGLLVGALGWFVPQVLGVGYGYVGDALNGKMALNLMALLVVLKLITVTASYASGNAGGILVLLSSLAQCSGGERGDGGARLVPGSHSDSCAYALVGMGTAFAGMVRRSHDFGVDDF